MIILCKFVISKVIFNSISLFVPGHTVQVDPLLLQPNCSVLSF